MERRRAASWLQMLPVMMAVAILAVSFNGEAVVAADGAQPPPDTNVLCVSKCGTCPTVCSSPPPPASSSSENNPVLSPPKGTGSSGGGYSSPSAPSSGEAKGGKPGGSNYYYFFTSGSSHGCTAPTAYSALLLPLLSLVAVFLQ
ncbi:hypothetical protein E2562_022514 [Oryza meyeriana var. granulata]|uniref:4Fe-4S ferredoxin-type domain-containing protein n=1 Tax=Oryza meyeriana var. granulata TaxID=110450 RepID=A0A6G1BN03_9ORYZ|nr:hypothetical protein E2562_022514 [Oryza meyeriana var. granulata]